jgi:uncharacterized protein
MLAQESIRIFGEMQLVSKVHKMSWDQFDEYVDILAGEIANSPWVPEHIIGLARGGLPLAVALSHKFDIPMTAVHWQTRDGAVQQVVNCPENSLVVDDINDSGLTLQSFMSVKAQRPKSMRTAVLINKSESVYDPDYTAWDSPYDSDVWFEFPWEK